MFRLLLAELKRSWLNYKRYPADVLISVFVLTVTFYFLLQGARYMAGPQFQFGDRQDAVIVGYWVWTISIFALSNTARNLSTEAVSGTLEQLYLSPFGPLRIFTTRMVGSLTLSLATSFLLLGLILVATQRTIAFPPQLLIPVLAVAIGAYGLGLAMGAASLIFKRVSHGINLLQLIFLVLAMVPVELIEGPAKSFIYLIPIAPAAALLRDLMVREMPLDWTRFGLALAGSLVYFLLGATVFKLADRTARRRGLVGHH